MSAKIEETQKKALIRAWSGSSKFWVSPTEYSGVALGKKAKRPDCVIRYIFPGDWTEDFVAETSRQSHARARNLHLVEDRFGAVYR